MLRSAPGAVQPQGKKIGKDEEAKICATSFKIYILWYLFAGPL